VIWDVDLSDRAWLGSYLPAEVPVVFDPPDRCAGRAEEVVSAFLLDVEEDPTGASATFEDLRDAEGHLTGRRSPGRRYRFNYLLTAWAQETEREHRLLGALLVGCALCAVLPPQFRTGVLARTGEVVLVRSAPRREGTAASAWLPAAGTARTGLHLQLVVPFVPDPEVDLPPAPKEIKLSSANRPGPRSRQPGGRISEPG
jgi:hypothetical protein